MRKRQQIQKQATNITNTRTMSQKSKDLQQSIQKDTNQSHRCVSAVKFGGKYQETGRNQPKPTFERIDMKDGESNPQKNGRIFKECTQ